MEALTLKPKLQSFGQPNAKSQLTEKDPDARKDRQKDEKGATEDEMAGWHHQLNEHEFEQTPGDNEGQEDWHAIVDGVAKSWTQFID